MHSTQEVLRLPGRLIGVGTTLLLAVLVAGGLGYGLATARSTSHAVSAPAVITPMPLTQAPDAIDRNSSATGLADKSLTPVDPSNGDLPLTGSLG